jgi:hypothetical protein
VEISIIVRAPLLDSITPKWRVLPKRYSSGID